MLFHIFYRLFYVPQSVSVERETIDLARYVHLCLITCMNIHFSWISIKVQSLTHPRKFKNNSERFGNFRKTWLLWHFNKYYKLKNNQGGSLLSVLVYSKASFTLHKLIFKELTSVDQIKRSSLKVQTIVENLFRNEICKSNLNGEM